MKASCLSKVCAVSVIAALGACVQARPVYMRIDAQARIDGRHVSSSTTWRTTISDTFPENSHTTLTGEALVIPIGRGQNIYGLLRIADQAGLTDAVSLIYGLDMYAWIESTRRGRKTPSTEPRSKLRDYAVRYLGQRRVVICAEGAQQTAVEVMCPVFVSFLDKDNPSSVVMLHRGHSTVINGITVIIDNVQVSYSYSVPNETVVSSRLPTWLSQSPLFIAERNGVSLGKLPRGTWIDSERQLRTTDFKDLER